MFVYTDKHHEQRGTPKKFFELLTGNKQWEETVSKLDWTSKEIHRYCYYTLCFKKYTTQRSAIILTLVVRFQQFLVHLLVSHIYSAIAVPNITGIGQVGYLSIIVGGWVV